jgi:hypothetical protein
MHRGWHGPSLADRAARSGVGPGDPPPPSAGPPSPPPDPGPGPRRAGGAGRGRHCWVHDPPDAPGTWPGLLVEWRQRDDGWHGRVAYAVDGDRGPVLVEAWLPAAQLQQG